MLDSQKHPGFEFGTVRRGGRLFAYIFAAVAGLGVGADPCPNGQAVADQLRSYVSCQIDPHINACAGIGTALGGRLLQKTLERRELRLIEQRKQLEAKVTESLYEFFYRNEFNQIKTPEMREFVARAYMEAAEKELNYSGRSLKKQSLEYYYDRRFDLKPKERLAIENLYAYRQNLIRANGNFPVYEPTIDFGLIMKGKETVDLASGFENFPAHMKEELAQQAREATNLVIEQVRAKGPLDENFIQQASLEMDKRLHQAYLAKQAATESVVPVPPKAEGKGIVSTKGVDELAERLTSAIKAVPGLEEELIIGRNSTYIKAAVNGYKSSPVAVTDSKMFENALSMARKIGGKAAPLVAGGIVTAALAVVDVAMSSTTMGCGDLDAHFTNRDSENGCRHKFEVNANVIRTLRLPPEQLAEVYKNTPGVCQYYEKLRDKLYEQPKFIGLECKPNGISLKTEDANGVKVETTAKYFGSSKKIRQITWKESTPSSSWKGPIQFDEEGKVLNPQSSYVDEKLVPMRLYIMDAHSCCVTGDALEHHECMEKFNVGSPASPRDVRDTKVTK